MILLTAGALTDPQLPARASNVYTTDARLGGIGRVALTGWHRPDGGGRVPPKKKFWLRRCEQILDINGHADDHYFFLKIKGALQPPQPPPTGSASDWGGRKRWVVVHKEFAHCGAR